MLCEMISEEIILEEMILEEMILEEINYNDTKCTAANLAAVF